MSEPIRIIAGADIHPLGMIYPLHGLDMRIVKKIVRHDYTTYFLLPLSEEFVDEPVSILPLPNWRERVWARVLEIMKLKVF